MLRKNLFKVKNQNGFSLLEVLIVVAIFTMLAAACSILLTAGYDSWRINKTQIELQQELRKATDWIAQELRIGGTSTITNLAADGTWRNTITFKISNGVVSGNIDWYIYTTTFVLGGTSSNQLQRQSGLDTRIIANNISSLQFRRLASAPNIVEVSLQATKNTFKGNPVTMSTNFKVRMRN